MCGKNFSIYDIHIPRKSLNLCFFTHKTEGVKEATNDSIKIQSENIKMTWNIPLFPFGMIAIFLHVMALQFCK